jgi:hypothetical protein
VQGGDLLEVSWKDAGDGFADVQLNGPAEFVYSGRITI